MRDEHPSAVGELARAAAEASSQGQRIRSAGQTWPGPSIIMAGDSNTTRDAVMSAMTRLHCPRFQADREMLALLAIADRGAGQL